MNIYAKAIYASALCAALALPSMLLAQSSAKARPAKAPPTAPLTKTVATETIRNPHIVSALPKKPPVITAVAPKPLLPGTQRRIIFVGGKPQSGGNAALNPQPIPPGHGGPGDPIH
jgi:hypothetical protein